MIKLNRDKLEFLYKYKVYIVLIVAFVLRLIMALIAYKDQIWLSFADDLGRVNFAKSLIQNGFAPTLSSYNTDEAIFAPIVPMIIALKLMIFGDNWLPIFILNAFIGTLTCYIIYLISHKFFNKKVSFFSMVWVALYPNFIRYVGTAGNDVWLVFLFSLTFLYAVKTINENFNIRSVLILGLSFVLLLHTDERYIAYSPFFALILLLGNSTIGVKLKKVFVFSGVAILLSTPWLIRNYMVYDDVVLISIRTTNLTSKIINHRPELIAFDHEPNTAHFTTDQIDSVKKGLLTVYPNTGETISDLQLKAMTEGNVPHQFNWQEKILSRTYFLWMPFKFHDNYRINGFTFVAAWSLGHNLASILGYAILLPFVIFAMIFLWEEKKYLVIVLFSAVLVYHTFIHVAFIPYTRDRYRNPIDFIVIILGCYGIIHIYHLFEKWKCVDNDKH